jgi:hypothetical protein
MHKKRIYLRDHHLTLNRTQRCRVCTHMNLRKFGSQKAIGGVNDDRGEDGRKLRSVFHSCSRGRVSDFSPGMLSDELLVMTALNNKFTC